MLNLKTMVMRDHRKEDYLDACIEHDYDPKATCPVWLKALGTWFGKDPEGTLKIAALQEFFGYTLMPHARFKKALLGYGKARRTGKSVILNAMVSMIGQRNTCSISVEDMDDPRRLAPIKGKALNAMSELPAGAMIADGGSQTPGLHRRPNPDRREIQETGDVRPICQARHHLQYPAGDQ